MTVKQAIKRILDDILKDCKRNFEGEKGFDGEKTNPSMKYLHTAIMPVLRVAGELEMYEDEWAKEMNKVFNIKCKHGCGWDSGFGFVLNQECKEHQTQYPGHA